jgi:hypothetical protein
MVLLSFAWSFSRVVVLFSFGAFFFDPWTDACEATWSGSTGGVFMADMTLGGFTRPPATRAIHTEARLFQAFDCNHFLD